MLTISVKADVKAQVDYLNRIKAGLGDKAIAAALNTTADQSKTQIARAITREYAVDYSTVTERLRVDRATSRGQQLTATLVGNVYGRAKRSMNVIHFVDAKTTARVWKKRGQFGGPELMARIKKSGGAKIIKKGAFIANNGRTVFIRLGPGHNARIDPVQTIHVPQMFNAKHIQQPIIKWIGANFPRIFEAKVKYFLSTVKQ